MTPAFIAGACAVAFVLGWCLGAMWADGDE